MKICKYINICKQRNFKAQFTIWLQSFGEFADGICTFVSFGFIVSSFEMSIAKWRMDSYMKEIKQSKKACT